MEKQSGNTRTTERRYPPTPTHRPPGHHIKTEEDRRDHLVAKHEKGPGGDEEDMWRMHGKPPEPPQGKAKGDDNTRIPIPSPPRGLLPLGRESLPIGGGRILIMANCGDMQQRRDIRGAERLPAKDLHRVRHTNDPSIRRRTPVHGA